MRAANSPQEEPQQTPKQKAATTTQRPSTPQAAPPKPVEKPSGETGTALGRLSALGIKEPWQTALLLPKGWEDFSQIIDHFDSDIEVTEGEWITLRGKLPRDPAVHLRGTPRLVGTIVDAAGNQVGFSQFGDTREFEKQLKLMRNDLCLYGQARSFNDALWLQNVQCVPPRWVGRLRPVYPGKASVIGPEKVRDRVFTHIRTAIPQAAQWIRTELAPFGEEDHLAEMAGLPGKTIDKILQEAHLPASLSEGETAQRALEHLAALGTAKKVLGKTKPRVKDWRDRMAGFPFELSEEQTKAAKEIVDGLRSHDPMHRILLGDVGTGKTAVYGVAAAACVDAGGKVFVLQPNMPLASQIANDFQTWWPDIKVQLVTKETAAFDPESQIAVGTTALLNKTKGHAAPEFLIVDEQQKFSREQREQMAGSQTNLLEVSATCIPRSQALIRYGTIQVSTLTKCHVNKKIHTRIWTDDQKGNLFSQVRHSLVQDRQVLIVYPKKEAGENDTTEQAKHTVEEAYKAWDKLYPGRVRFSHGGLSDEEKDRALTDMKADKADLLIATTVVEVGINLPRLYHEVIVHPDLLGLSTLHQLRGRLARAGGAGWCDLYLPKEVKAATMERLKIFSEIDDGFKLAEMDMKLRGAGDLGTNSEKQTGSDNTFLFGRPIKFEDLDRAVGQLTDLQQAEQEEECPGPRQ